jgi:hypothetical protein
MERRKPSCVGTESPVKSENGSFNNSPDLVIPRSGLAILTQQPGTRDNSQHQTRLLL